MADKINEEHHRLTASFPYRKRLDRRQKNVEFHLHMFL